MCGSVDGWSRRKAEEYETIASLESQESLEPVGVWLAIRSVSFNCACTLVLIVVDVVVVVYLLQSAVSGEVYRLPPHVYASPCLPTYPVPFSDVSLVAALQRMSTSYCHPTTTAPPPSLSSSCNPLHQLGDLPPRHSTATSLSLATYSFPTTGNSFAYTVWFVMERTNNEPPSFLSFVGFFQLVRYFYCSKWFIAVW